MESWECKANPTGNRQIGANINDGGDDDDDEEEDDHDHDHAPGDGRRRAPITKSYALGNMAATEKGVSTGSLNSFPWFSLLTACSWAPAQ